MASSLWSIPSAFFFSLRRRSSRELFFLGAFSDLMTLLAPHPPRASPRNRGRDREDRVFRIRHNSNYVSKKERFGKSGPHQGGSIPCFFMSLNKPCRVIPISAAVRVLW